MKCVPPTWRPEFNTKSVRVGFVVQKASMQQVSLRVLRLVPSQHHSNGGPCTFLHHHRHHVISALNDIIPTVPHAHSSIITDTT